MSLETKEYAKRLVEQMTLEEKISQMRYESPAIERLHIPAYNWWNEALHGVARSGVATMFPQAIALAATFDEELIEKIISCGKKAGEMYWHLPSLPECKEAIKSDIADLTNSAGRAASTITGGLFIGEFIDEGTPWAHLDIGGTSTAAKTEGFKPKGCTAFGVRTFVNIAKEL